MAGGLQCWISGAGARADPALNRATTDAVAIHCIRCDIFAPPTDGAQQWIESKSSPGSLAGITDTGIEVDATAVNGRVRHANQRCQCGCDVHRLDRQILLVTRTAGTPEHNRYTAVVVPRRAVLRYVE